MRHISVLEYIEKSSVKDRRVEKDSIDFGYQKVENIIQTVKENMIYRQKNIEEE